MLTIDCNDVESILNELAIYVSDQVAAIPAIKLHQFVLAPIVDDEPINQDEVVASIKEFLESIGEKRNFGVISNNNNIAIKSIFGKKIEANSPRARWSQKLFYWIHNLKFFYYICDPTPR